MGIFAFHLFLNYGDGTVQSQPMKINKIARETLVPLDERLWTQRPYPAEDAKLLWEAPANSQCSVADVWLGAGLYIPFQL